MFKKGKIEIHIFLYFMIKRNNNTKINSVYFLSYLYLMITNFIVNITKF